MWTITKKACTTEQHAPDAEINDSEEDDPDADGLDGETEPDAEVTS